MQSGTHAVGFFYKNLTQFQDVFLGIRADSAQVRHKHTCPRPLPPERANARERCEHQRADKKQVVQTSCEPCERFIQIPHLAGNNRWEREAPRNSPSLPRNLRRLALFRDQKSMGMAMFKRTFARTILDNLRAPHVKMWGFEAKGPENSPELRPEHYHGISLPCFLHP